MTQTRPPSDSNPCLVHPEIPAVWTSLTGHHFCQNCKDSWYRLNLEEMYPALETYPYEPVDLRSLMSGQPPEEEWAVEPILPAGKLVGIVSKRGEGKSLLLLDIAASKASGQPTLTQSAGKPTHVIYIDMEMGPDDLYERLADLGYLPDNPVFDILCDHLHYYQLVALPPLDTEAGGQALEDLVERHQATLVIVDTVSRVVSGAENDAEPYRDLFRHTETMLKRRRVTLARLDHLGKNKELGSRGSSAKEDPLDVVWHLTTLVTGAIELTLTKGRQVSLPRTVVIHKEEDNGTFRHVIHPDLAPDWLLEVVERIDQLGLPADLSLNKTILALKEAGLSSHRSKVSQAVRFRKGRQSGSENTGTTPEPPSEPPYGTTRNHPAETLINVDDLTGTTFGTGSEPVWGVFPPLKGGTTQPREPEEEEFEPDPDDLAAFLEEAH